MVGGAVATEFVTTLETETAATTDVTTAEIVIPIAAAHVHHLAASDLETAM